MTPWQLSVLVEAAASQRKTQVERDIWMCWQTGRFARTDMKLPKFESLIKRQTQPMDAKEVSNRLRATFMAHNERLKG